MGKKRRKGTTLPRVTLLAYSRTDLLRFAESVEKLSALVGDLRVIAEQLDRATASKRRTTAKPTQPEGGE